MSQPSTENTLLWVNMSGLPKSCSVNSMPLASVSVSSTNPTATSRNRNRSSVSSGGSAADSGSGRRRCRRFSSPISTSACSAATRNIA